MSPERERPPKNTIDPKSTSRLHSAGLLMIFTGLALLFSGVFFGVYSQKLLKKEVIQEEVVRKPDASGKFLYDLSEFLTAEGIDLHWTKVESSNLVISYYAGDRADIDFTTGVLQKIFPRIAGHLGTDSNEKIQVVLFPTVDELSRYVKYEDAKRIAGLSVPPLDTIFIPLQSPYEPADFVATHELTHLLLRRAILPHTPPLWLDEGIATYEGVNNPGTAYRLEITDGFKKQAGTSEFITLREIEQVGNTAGLTDDTAGLWYVESYSLIDFIARNYGESKFQLLLDSLKTGGDASQAVKYALGMSLEELETKWRVSLSGESEAKIKELIETGYQRSSNPFDIRL